MSIREAAARALAEAEEANRLAREAKAAQQHADASEKTRQFFARLGVSADDVSIDGGNFVLDGIPGVFNLAEGVAHFSWWCSEPRKDRGNTYDSAAFTSLPSLAKAFDRVDAAKASNRYWPR